MTNTIPVTEEIAAPVIPLQNMEQYEALSDAERLSRYNAALDRFTMYAINYSKRVKSASDYLLKDVKELQDVGNFDTVNTTQKQSEIRIARKVVDGEELCGTILDKLICLCVTPGTIENVKSPKLLALLNRWKDLVGNLESSDKQDTKIFTQQQHGLSVTLSQILERLLVDGDAILSEIWEKDVVVDDGKYFLPYKINIHDTLLCQIDEDLFVRTGQEKITLTNSLNGSSGLLTRAQKKSGKSAGSPLWSDTAIPFTSHLKLRPKTFSPWGTTFFKRAFLPIAGKKRLEALELNTIEGLINRLTILKAGKIDAEQSSGIIAPARLAILERMISKPKVNNLLLWPGDDLDVLDIAPDDGLLAYDNKYKASTEKILMALGVPRVIVDGEGSSTENWQKFLGTLAVLDNIRNTMLIPWVNSVLLKIAQQNGFNDERPRFTMTRMKLYDLTTLLNAIKVFYDRGLMSELTALTNGDLEFEVEKSRREYESTEGIVASFGGPQALPFSKNDPTGDNKEGMTNPERDINKEDKVEASIRDNDRRILVATFNDYLMALHDSYARKINLVAKQGNYESIRDVLLVYSFDLKRDMRAQMMTLFNGEVLSHKVDKKYIDGAIDWISEFVDSYVGDLESELMLVINSNKDDKKPLLPDLIAGVMAAMKGKRLRLYSSSVFNKAKAAGMMSAMEMRGESKVQWKATLSDRCCQWCQDMHNKVLDLDTFFANFPPHPNCECWGESTDNELSAIIPIKDEHNWSKPVK